ncbi:MAG: hypothetical protein K940chlam9_00724 [Chlamydiae bacterium]|nr:hypothetical protein [Chlamydiota bacterium]
MGTPVNAEITLQNLPPEQQVEEGLLPENEAEQMQPQGKGFLTTPDGKHYHCQQETSSPRFQQLSKSFSETTLPKEPKNFHAKEGEKPSNLKEQGVKVKVLQTQKSESTSSEKQTLDKENTRPAEKVEKLAKQQLKSQAPPSPLPKPFTQKATEKQVSTPLPKKEVAKEKAKQEKTGEKGERQTKTHDSSGKERTAHSPLAKEQTAKKEQETQQKRDRKEEEGFAEDERENNKQKYEDEGEEGVHGIEGLSSSTAIAAPSNAFEEKLVAYANEESILSEVFQMRVTQFDIFLLFIEILQLSLKSKEQERIARMHERQMQIEHMEEVVKTFKTEGKNTMFASIGAGVLAIVSGFCPIIGYMKGDWILGKLSGVFSSLQGMNETKFFASATKMTSGASEMQKAIGQIQGTFAQGNRSLHQHKSELYRSDTDETTRSIEEIKDQWKNIENFLYQQLQMQHDTIRQLYS